MRLSIYPRHWILLLKAQCCFWIFSKRCWQSIHQYILGFLTSFLREKKGNSSHRPHNTQKHTIVTAWKRCVSISFDVAVGCSPWFRSCLQRIHGHPLYFWGCVLIVTTGLNLPLDLKIDFPDNSKSCGNHTPISHVLICLLNSKVFYLVLLFELCGRYLWCCHDQVWCKHIYASPGPWLFSSCTNSICPSLRHLHGCAHRMWRRLAQKLFM